MSPVGLLKTIESNAGPDSKPHWIAGKSLPSLLRALCVFPHSPSNSLELGSRLALASVIERSYLTSLGLRGLIGW